jgi:putative PEP-CTERM system integral membrane protein
VRAVPTDVGMPTPQAFGRLAVVVDTSRSMGDHASSVHATLAELTGRGHAFDLFVAPSPWSADVPRRVALEDFDPSWYGGHSHDGVLADFARVRGDAEYAAVVVVSDSGSFAFQNDPAPASLATLDRDTPVWMLHLGGLPYAYRDELVDLVRASGGGAATDLGTVLSRLHTPVIDGFAWTFEPAVGSATLATDDPFAPLAAAALIMHLGDRGTDLDAVHAIAKQASVVTPWSSMIVLVDDRQRKALAKASEDADRFDREAETGVEQTTAPGAALEVNGTPEPHEWMLLAIAALGLLAMARSRRRGFVVAGA